MGGLWVLHGKGHASPAAVEALPGWAGGAQGPRQGDAAGSGPRGRFHPGMPQASEQSRTHCPAGPTWAQNSRGPRLRGAVPTEWRFTSRNWTKPWNNPSSLGWGAGHEALKHPRAPLLRPAASQGTALTRLPRPQARAPCPALRPLTPGSRRGHSSSKCCSSPSADTHRSGSDR